MNRRRNITILAVAALIAVAIAAVVYVQRGRAKSTRPELTEAQQQVVYYCPMHPTVQSHEPGNCPICGMRLVRRTDAASRDAAAQLASEGFSADEVEAISLSPEQRVTANVQTVTVALMTGTGDLVTTGRVTFDERRTAQITAYAAGRIERLMVNFTGDTVRRGQAVATVYSPDLYATQQEFLLALSNRERMREAGFAGARTAADDLVDSSRRRLLLFGMSQSQVGELERTGQPVYATTIVSPVGGIVTNKLVVPQQYVAIGQPLFEVADLSHVWIDADVYEQQLPGVEIGQRVEISSPAIPDRTLPGVVAFIQPTLAGQTRTARVRIDMANPGLTLKPDMYVAVRLIGVESAEHIMVPASAVIDRGRNRFVWVEVGPGTYEPRKVTAGARHGAEVVIEAGLSAGDVIVVEGGFLLDSEARLRSVTSGSGHESH